MDDRAANLDQSFWTRARRHLMRYGGQFVDFVVTSLVTEALIHEFSEICSAAAIFTDATDSDQDDRQAIVA